MTDTPTIGHNSSAFDIAAEQAERIIEQYGRVPVEGMTVEQAKLAIVLVKQARLAKDAVKEATPQPEDSAVIAHMARLGRCSMLQRSLDDLARTVTGLVDAARKKLGLRTIVSDFGPRAYARAQTHLSVEPAKLPDEYWQPNYDKIKADLKAGLAIAGVAEIETEITVIS